MHDDRSGVRDTPPTEADLASLVRAAARDKRPLFSEGRGTKRHFGPAGPEARTQRVSLRKLDRIVAYEPADMVLCVQAGARLADVQAALAEHGQWLPADPPFADATIGRILATRSSGPRRLGYGPLRDMLLGTRAISAAGDVVQSGGRVVKNVSGYDLHRLQVGAFGSLGVLVEANFRVSAKPEASAIFVCSTETLASATKLLLEIHASPLRPTLLQALRGKVASQFAATSPKPHADGSPVVAFVGAEGSRTWVDRHVRDLEGRLADHAALLEGLEADPVWAALREVPAHFAGHVAVRVGALPHALPELLERLPKDGIESVGVVVDAALGLAHAYLAAPADAATCAPVLGEWQKVARASGGYAVVESAPLDLPNRSALLWGSGEPNALGAALKRKLDPDGILNPGRMAW